MTIVILGAGELGGALARQIAAADSVSSVVLIDDAGRIAEGKALDIRQAAPVDRYATSVTGTTDIAAATSAHFLLLADRASAPGTEWQDDQGVALVKRVAEFNHSAPIICAGASQLPLIERCVREHAFPRQRVIGSAPEAFRSAVVSMTALEARCDPRDVNLTVVGRPPNQLVVPWEDASIAGRKATSLLTPPMINRIDARLSRLWPPGPLTLAAAAARLLSAAIRRAPTTLSVFVALNRDEGSAGRVAMLPITMTPQGVATVIHPRLSGRDQVRLETVLQS